MTAEYRYFLSYIGTNGGPGYVEGMKVITRSAQLQTFDDFAGIAASIGTENGLQGVVIRNYQLLGRSHWFSVRRRRAVPQSLEPHPG